MLSNAPILTISDAAAERVKALIAEGDGDVQGVRVGVKARGCSGMSYFVEFAKEPKKFEDVIEEKGVRIFVDPASSMFLIGSEMDWQEDRFNSTFIFTNPNEKGRCGCGESFHV